MLRWGATGRLISLTSVFSGLHDIQPRIEHLFGAIFNQNEPLLYLSLVSSCHDTSMVSMLRDNYGEVLKQSRK